MRRRRRVVRGDIIPRIAKLRRSRYRYQNYRKASKKSLHSHHHNAITFAWARVSESPTASASPHAPAA